MEAYKYTNKGGRESNQDYAVFKSLSDDCSIYVVVDGMGGYEHGDIAAKIIGDAVVECAESNKDELSPEQLLKEAITYSNENIMLKRIALGGVKMGAVIVVLLVTKDCAYISWLGDSRVYQFRENKEIYRTEDHSVVNDLIKNNIFLSPKDTERYSHIVNRAIMGDDDIGDIPVEKVDIQPNDIFILCSDGLYKGIGVTSVLKFDEKDNSYLDKYSNRAADNYTFIKVAI